MLARADLSRRSTQGEQMDTDCVDYFDYRRCLHDLSSVNRVTRTYAPTLAWLAARGLLPGERVSVLDVGFGYGDMLRRIRAWGESRNLALELTGVDANPWAERAAREATPGDGIAYRTGDVFAFDPDRRFDFVISAQFTHHLTGAEIVAFIQWMERVATRGWFISDLHRHVLPYYGFPLLARAAFWHRFVRSDGQISIARSFIPEEWRALVSAAGLDPASVEIKRHAPFRLCVGRAR
jgi:2-polyprenyl-3-methyl-5-hydroxy-6-metoxy-1,4-benzoquinol methylase